MKLAVILVLCVASLLLGGLLGLSVLGFLEDEDEASESRTPTTAESGRTPKLFTNANGDEVWTQPGYHLGARVRMRGRVAATEEAPDGLVVAMHVSGYPVGAYIFDPAFDVAAGDRIEVTGDVRGPLGGKLTLGIRTFGPLGPGMAIIDAEAARKLAGGASS